ncbi:MAG: hypothetical protein OXC68_04480 [Aestuariivita sp.]|nr:hypothetical protein [Aestuariivita sp.]
MLEIFEIASDGVQEFSVSQVAEGGIMIQNHRSGYLTGESRNAVINIVDTTFVDIKVPLGFTYVCA